MKTGLLPVRSLCVAVLFLSLAQLATATELVYVTSGLTDEVLRYDVDTGTFFGVFVSSGAGGLDGPDGLLFGEDGRLYVASENSNQVLRYDGTTGSFIDVFVAAGSGGLTTPVGLVFGPNGNLFVASFGSDQVIEYDGTSGSLVGTFVSAGSGGLDNPTVLVFGPDGNLYVSSTGTSAVLRYDGSSGAFIDAFVPIGSGGLFNPDGLIFGPDGHLYVSSQSSNEVLRYDGITGAFVDEFVGAGVVSTPLGLGFAASGNLVVAGASDDRVREFDGTTGGIVQTFDPTNTAGLDRPQGLTFVVQFSPTPHPTSTPTATATPAVGCPAIPVAGCNLSAKSILKIKDKSPGGPSAKDKVIWKWLKGPAQSQTDFGNPVSGGTSYTLCVYDSAGLVSGPLGFAVPAGGTCDGKPCWKAINTKGWKYKDKNKTNDGILKLLMKGGDAGKSKIILKGKDGNLPIPMLPLDDSAAVTVQLSRDDSSNCWESVLAGPGIKNVSDQFKDKIP